VEGEEKQEHMSRDITEEEESQGEWGAINNEF